MVNNDFKKSIIEFNLFQRHFQKQFYSKQAHFEGITL